MLFSFAPRLFTCLPKKGASARLFWYAQNSLHKASSVDAESARIFRSTHEGIAGTPLTHARSAHGFWFASRKVSQTVISWYWRAYAKRHYRKPEKALFLYYAAVGSGGSGFVRKSLASKPPKISSLSVVASRRAPLRRRREVCVLRARMERCVAWMPDKEGM